MKRFIQIILLLSVIPVITFCIEQTKEDSPEDKIVTAITQTADYLSKSVINEEGVSKCDYNMIEGTWYPYEPPWLPCYLPANG